MISAVNGTISALQAYKTQLEATSNNIANVNAEGFEKSKVTLKEGVHGDLQVAVNRVSTPGHRSLKLKGDQMAEKKTSNVDLTEELPQMIVTQHAYEANMKVLQAQDKMLGTTLDILG